MVVDEKKKIIVNTIMPSLSGFIRNFIEACEQIEQKREIELENVFDDKKEYDKYKSLVGTDELYNVLTDFKKIYGDEWMYSREYKSELKEKFVKTIKIKAGIICDDVLKENILKPLELRKVLIFEIPVYKMTKKNRGENKCVGHIKLLTNGKMVSTKFQPRSKAFSINDEIFKECFISVTSNEDNKKLFKMTKDLINKVDENCHSFGYELEKEIIYNVLVYVDLKNILKKARKA